MSAIVLNFQPRPKKRRIPSRKELMRMRAERRANFTAKEKELIRAFKVIAKMPFNEREVAALFSIKEAFEGSESVSYDALDEIYGHLENALVRYEEAQ